MRHEHYSLPVSAEAAVWHAANCSVSVNSDGTPAPIKVTPHGFEALLVLGMAAGKADDDVVAWAMAESQRRHEEQRRSNALYEYGVATKELAAAIRGCSEENALKAIMGRLSEKTQYAIRQQLGR